MKTLDTQTFIGNAGAVMVKVSVNADLLITDVEIDETVFAKTQPEVLNDLTFMADLFKAAANQAIDEAVRNKIQFLKGIPDLLKGIAPNGQNGIF